MASVETAGGRRIHYQEAGDGPPLVMIAGLGAPRGSWADAIACLSAAHRCVALDNRDAGESDAEPADYRIADMADDTAALLRALGVARAHVMGSSMGGFIAQHLALNYPYLVASLVLVGTTSVTGLRAMAEPADAEWIADPLERARQRLRQTVAPGSLDARPERLEELAAQTRLNRMTRDGYARQVRAINTSHDTRARLREIRVPTLVVHGDVDPLVPLRAGELLAEGIPGARLAVLPGIGHIPHRETPDEFCALVGPFLADVE